MRKIKVGVIGVGYLGRIHTRIYRQLPGIELVGISDIKGYHLSLNQNVKIKDLQELFEGYVTRIPIFDEKNVVKLVIHQSLLYKFIALKNIEATKVQPSFHYDNATLDEFLDYKNMRELTESLAFVSTDALLADAKKAMEEKKNCQDVFVTENGKEDEPVKGWLTNVAIARHIEV